MSGRDGMRGTPLLSWADKKRARRFGGAIVDALPAPSELKWHIALARDLRTKPILKPGWELWTHFPAGGKRDGRTAGILELMGTKPGWPDLLFVSPIGPDCPYGKLHGLELKKLGEDIDPNGTQAQVAAAFRASNLPHAVVDNIDAALATLSGWGALRLRVTL